MSLREARAFRSPGMSKFFLEAAFKAEAKEAKDAKDAKAKDTSKSFLP